MNFGPPNKRIAVQMLHFPHFCYVPDPSIILVEDEPETKPDHPGSFHKFNSSQNIAWTLNRASK